MTGVTVGFSQWGAAIELRLLAPADYAAARAEQKQAKDARAFTRLYKKPGRGDPDALIIGNEDDWTHEVAAHEMMHCALHLADLYRLDTTATAEVLPQIAGDFTRFTGHLVTVGASA